MPEISPDLLAQKPLFMKVDKVGFLLDRLGQDCAPLQFLRELTQNGIEAIQRVSQSGQIIWDVDWTSHDLGGSKVMKLCITDTGDGMTTEEMVRFINQLSSSSSLQSMSTNYGIGAKIAAATRNPAGIIYQSWKNSEGFMIKLQKDEDTGNYGLHQWQLGDGSYQYYIPLDDDVKPAEIGEHGTKVILIGRTSDANTLIPPEGTASPSRWISKYLNTRYFQFPEIVTVRAREGWENPRSDKDRNVLRTLTGQKAYLDQHAETSGVRALETAKVHWWILRDEPAIPNNSGFIESGGHVAALYQDELYDRATARAGTAMLQQFGILFGARYVVLYLEPNPQDDQTLTTNTARTTLLLDGDKLPWSDLAHEFRANMPSELAHFVSKHAATASESDHIKSIRDRLKAVMDLYKVSRYRPIPEGFYLSDATSSVRVGMYQDLGAKSKGGGGDGMRAGTDSKGVRDADVGNIYHLFEKKDGDPSAKVEADPFPTVRWVTIKDGSRTEDDMEDKAAKYLADQNLLLANADFRVFDDMVDRLCKDRQGGHGVQIGQVVEDIVRQWFEQALVETVIGIQQLKGSKEWGPHEIDRALSEEALTSAVMQRYHVFNACKRELGAKLGGISAPNS